MTDGRHFEKPVNRHNSAMVGWIAVKFAKKTHLDSPKLCDRQKFDFLKVKMAEGRCPDMSAVDILRTTQQRTEPVRLGYRWECILALLGEYD